MAGNLEGESLLGLSSSDYGGLDELDRLFERHKDTWLDDEDKEVFEEAMERYGSRHRVKRDMPTMYMGKKKKLRTCANMNGILGGSNAFNYVSFVVGILTLVVNVNNNINNNNNNLNQANINTASNNNANANSNNNNANVINVMPPGKRRKRRWESSRKKPAVTSHHFRRVPAPFDVHEDKVCVVSQQSSGKYQHFQSNPCYFFLLCTLFEARRDEALPENSC